MFISNERDNKLKSAFELYNQRMIESLPTDEELSKISFSETFERKMKKLLSLQKKTYYKLINTVGKRVAIIVLTLIISLTATTFSVKALREAVIEFITETYEKFTKITVEKELPNTRLEFIKIKPKYIPEGFELEHETYIDDELYHITFRNSQNQSITYSQQNPDDAGIDVDTEDIEYQKIYVKSYEGILYNNKEYYTLVFATQDYYFIVTSNLPYEQLQLIAESIL